MSEKKDESIQDPCHMLQPSGVQAWKQSEVLAAPGTEQAQGVVKEVAGVLAGRGRALASLRGFGLCAHNGVESAAESQLGFGGVHDHTQPLPDRLKHIPRTTLALQHTQTHVKVAPPYLN